MIYTYLLQSTINSGFYAGIAKDPGVRLKEHNSGRVASTKKQKPWQLVYTKKHGTYTEARKHEKWLKKKNAAYKSKLAGQAATRYLDELEKEGFIRQVGQTGNSVYYEKTGQ